MRLKGMEKVEKIYFIGIGGVSMSALAKFASECGYRVSGSDSINSEMTRSLAFYGIKTFIGSDPTRSEFLEADCVVYTDAINEENAELSASRRLGKSIYRRIEFLSIISYNFSHTVAIAGSHGKTTCTSICAHVLKSCAVPFMAHIGGEDSVFGNYHFSGEEYLITEACEYKKNLLNIIPEVAVLLNVDKDHMECYQDEEDLIKTFQKYCLSAKTAFVCADDENYKYFSKFSTFGVKNVLSDYRATQFRSQGECYSFTIEEYGKAICRIKLRAVGFCNVYNATATFAAMRSLGFNEKEIVRGIEDFTAVKRRFEKIGVYRGASFVCDYAHHPKEILSTLATAKRMCHGELHVVFQPHTYSRTKLLMREFVSTLRNVPNLLLYKTYPARESYDEDGSAKKMAQILSNGQYAETPYELKTWLKQRGKKGDLVLFLGAGDIYDIAKHVLNVLS